eukprot:1343581-Prymnesium_polylepis.1
MEGRPPVFTGDAHPLLGFDETIDAFCGAAPKNTYRYMGGHAGTCVKANLNILSLYTERVPYNLCRNLEWQVCAATGQLPGQTTPTILFAHEPGALDA